jgi:ribose transport system permease protein
VNALSAVRRPRLTTTGIVWLALAGILVLSAVLVGLRGQNLFTVPTTVDLFTRSSLLGFVAIGQTFVILSRSLDLSVGYVVALSSLVAATTMAGDPARVPLGIAAALLVSAAVGLVNGLVVTKLKVNPFIATLGVGLILKAYLDTRYQGPAGDVPGSFQGFGYTRIGVLPVSTAVMILVAILGIVVLNRSKFGYHLFAVGGNDEVARFSGIRTDRALIGAHVLCSACAGIAGLLIAARFGTGSALVYNSGYDLDSIAAVVLGGTLLLGGRGSVAGTLGGVFILAVLDSVFNVLQVDPFFKDVLRGVIIVAAVAIYARRQIDPTRSRPRFAPGGGPADAPPTEPPPEDPGRTAEGARSPDPAGAPR